jgi:spermidine/putrescine transport system permease protein
MIPRALRYTLSGISWPVYVMLYTPLALVAYYSLTPGAANIWAAYQILFHDGDVFAALQRSIVLALGSAACSTALGTLLGYGLFRFRDPRATGFGAHAPGLIIYAPIIMPSIVFGIAELMFFNLVHNATGLLAAGLQTMIIAHITFQVPYVALTVVARLTGLDPYMFEASYDLYADGWKSFWHLVVPVVQPAIIGGFMLGLTLSIDDFTISFFTAGPGSNTLPLYIYSAIARKGISPEINAIGTLMISTIIILALVHFFITSRRERGEQLAARGNMT